MSEPTDIMMWRISDKMSGILETEYILGGSVGASLWSLSDREFDGESSKLTSGSMVLLYKEMEGSFYIIGGGYLLGWHNLGVKESWDLYGVRNGAVDYEDFLNEIRMRGGNENSTLYSAVVMHTFVFNENDSILLPEELQSWFIDKQHFTISLNEPAGRYIKGRVLDVREAYIGNDGNDWQGLYYMASHRNSKSYMAEFHARVLTAYNYTCALTGTHFRPIMMVAHIQPFYDSQFQSVSNGIVLRSDVYTLFKAGYITFVYNDAGDKLICKVSKTMVARDAGEYMEYDGKELLLPQDKERWPCRRYMSWHNKNCFESWMKVGGSHV